MLPVISKHLQKILPNPECYCFMTDSDLNVISSSDFQQSDSPVYKTVLKALPNEKNKDFFSLDINNEKMFVFSSFSETTDFCYFVVSPAKNINTISSMLTQLVTGYFIFIFLLLLLLISLAIFIFFRPIKHLFNGMKLVQNGDFNARLPQNSNYEINYINEHFNSMTEIYSS